MARAEVMNGENITNETRLTRIQAFFVEILNDLLRAPIEATDVAVQRAISRIGAYCRRDRSYVFVRRGELAFNTHEWCAPGIEPAIDQLQGLPWEAYGAITEPLETGRPMHVPDVAQLPAGSPTRELLEMQEIRSVLLVPMRYEGETYGFIGFDGVHMTHAFLPGEVYLLQSVADVICSVLTRRETDQAVRAAQQSLVEERAFLASVLATSAIGIMVIDDKGVIRFVNDAACRVTGVRRATLVGARHDEPRWAITWEDGTPFGEGEMPFDQVTATGRPVVRQRIRQNFPDAPRFMTVHAAPVAAGGPDNARVVYAMVDETEQVRAEMARAEALEEARRASSAKSNFLAKMSHEMRTPLNGVLGIAEVLERMISDPNQRRMVQVLHESGSLLLGIINDLLDMSKIEADQLEVETLPFVVDELSQRLEAVHTLKATAKQISFGIQVLGDGVAPRLGDPHRLTQILHNLISNAVKFTEQGSVAVEIDCRAPDRIGIEVRDTGIGMCAETVRNVFEEFGQADSSIARRFGGTGLGMSIVKRLVSMMDGSIEIESAPGLGTRVRVDLPVMLADKDPGAAAASGQASPLKLPDLSRLRVLAADDNRTNRMILGAMLGQLGVSAVLVPDGGSALKSFDENCFDVVILDISMPDMDGIAVMRELRRREGMGQARGRPMILAFTANAMSHQVESYLRAGFDDCLTKPLQISRLVSVLQGAVDAGAIPAPAERHAEPAAIRQKAASN